VEYRLIGSTWLSGTRRGADEMMRALAPFSAALATPIRLVLHRLTAEGECVAVEASGRSTLHSGAPYDNTYCFVLRFAADRVVELVEYLDTDLLARAFAVPADREELLRRMDLNMWEMFREIVRGAPDGEILDGPRFTMARSRLGTFFDNMVMVRAPVELDEVLAGVREFYVTRNLPFSIWTRAHADAALEGALEARGFTRPIQMPGMALLGDPGTLCAPPGLEIRPATDDAGRRDFLAVTAEAYAIYGRPRETTEWAFAALASVCAPHLQGFVGYLGEEPVAAAAVYVTHGVAGIGWVGTVTAHRGRRHAEAVTWAAVREGFRRGGAFANLQASPMGRPVYERMGFTTPTEYRVWVGTP
jgi:ketosteroid isomerase-like protein